MTKKDTIGQGTPSIVEGTSSNGINRTINQGLPSKKEGASINGTRSISTIDQGTPSRVEGTSSNSVNSLSPIIPNNSESFNPVKELLPAWLISSALSNKTNNRIETFLPISQNLPINIPVLKGGIQINVNNIPDLSNYTNPLTGNTKIFSREDIGKMSTKEYDNSEKEINAQLKSIGIPANLDLEFSSLKGDTVYVNPYTKDDGTEVRGHYRSRPNRI